MTAAAAPGQAPDRRVVKPLSYADRCERYACQAGWKYDEHALSIARLTPRQRRRALHKERRSWARAEAVPSAVAGRDGTPGKPTGRKARK